MLQVKNWDKFQHYKDRNPPWIKLATDTFQNYEFSKLSDASKLLAICIWTLASRSKDGTFPGDFDYIKRQCSLGDSVKESHLKELIKHGFINDASGLLAVCKQSAIPETETEIEAEKRDNNIVPQDVPSGIWSDFITHRKAKKAPVTKTAIEGIRKEAAKAKITLEQAIVIMVNRGWTGFKAEWMNNGTGQRQNSAVTIGNGSPAGEQTRNGFGGRKSQTELYSEASDRIIAERRRKAAEDNNQKLPGLPGSANPAITADIRDVEEIR